MFPTFHDINILYRVAHNMLYVQDDCLNSEDLAIAKLLLENCIKLIGDNDKKVWNLASYTWLYAGLWFSLVCNQQHIN